MACHPEPFGCAQDKLREGSLGNLSCWLKFPGILRSLHLHLRAGASVAHSHLPGVPPGE